MPPAKRKRKKATGLTREAREIARHLGGVPGGPRAKSEGGGDGDSLFGGLKSFGESALKALTIPGALVTTSLTNVIQGAKGDPLVSWKNLAGTFRGDKFAGGAGLLRSFGVSNATAEKWGGLALDVALDPLWFVGVGALNAGTKMGTSASKIAAASRGEHLMNARGMGQATRELAKGLGKDPTAESDIFRMGTQADVQRALAKQFGVTPSLRFGLGRNKMTGFRRGPQLPLWPKPILKKDLAKITPARFNLSPLGAVVARGQDRAKATGDMMAREMKLAFDEAGIGDDVLATVGAVMTSGNRKLAETRALVEDLRASGVWTEKHDKAMRVITQVSRRQAKQLGWVTHRQQAAVMDRWLRDKLDEIGPALETASRAVARAEEAKGVALSTVKQTRDTRIESVVRAAGVEKDRLNQGLAAMQEGVTTAQARLVKAEQHLAQVEAQAAQRLMDPSYARRLAPSVKGRKDVYGWSPRDAAEKAARARASAVNKVLRRERARVQAMREAIDGSKQQKGLVRQLGTALESAEKQVRKIDKRTNQQTLKLMDDFAKHERTVAATHDERIKALSTQLDDFLKDQDKIAAQATAFAASKNLREFTAGRRYKVKEGELRPLKTAKKQPPLTLEEVFERVDLLKNRGVYIKHGADPEMMDEVSQWFVRARTGRLMGPRITGSQIPEPSKLLKRRTADSPFSQLTPARAVDQMMKDGVPEEDALMIQQRLEELFKFAKEDVPYSKDYMPDVIYRPDFNAYNLTAGRERDQYNLILEKSFEDELRKIFPGKKQQEYEGMWDDLTTQYMTKRIPGSPATFLGYAKMRDSKGNKVPSDVPRVVMATAWLKSWFTVMNPGHYVMNAVGSFINDFIEGNWRHAMHGFGPNLPGHAARKLGRADLANTEAMSKVYKLGDVELTGQQVATYARLSGLGIGYTQAEIEMVAHIFEAKGKVKTVARLMNKLNMDRENADRLWSWMNHIKGGDDPFTAASKVIRTKFDYNAATHFERIWMRNLMLFYTWYKNNLILQGYGVFTKPGIYSTLAHVEHARPKDEAEPSWWKKAGGLYSPFGLITFGNPMADIFKFDVSQENFRKNVVGALTPFISTPLAIAANKDFFTGAELSKFADQNVPHPAGYLLNPLGVGTESRARAEGEKAPAIPWYLAKLLKDFSGPYGSSLGALTQPDAEANRAFGVVPRLTGVRMNPKEPEKWERSLKARNAKRKADKTRKKNYES